MLEIEPDFLYAIALIFLGRQIIPEAKAQFMT